MFTDNEPKFTLGLKKKPEGNQSQADVQKRPRLTLGRKSADNKEGLPSVSSRYKFRPQDEKSQRTPVPQTPTTVRMPRTHGKLEVTIKISELPNWIEAIKNGWQRFCINVDGQVVQMMVRPRVWNKLLKANEEYPLWVASITGKMGPRFKNGFELLEPAIQVYEKQVKVNDAESSISLD